ncbi:hypothetical protein [Aquisalimonas asiatica]|uniref:SMODS and SLOG-associating 2TM effector domain-containing protein n=1 Tax=Aquisalimonas asiatica TaxID=406100 RepID=A0A1H8S502_9GAMM|nr:hypothetical protein [Aquisalimonas asiatica]SEO73243.1 hypothetical protein SAMN04488052_102455 [Aquisalimonas asiatica]
MDNHDVMGRLTTPRMKSPGEPPREIEMSSDDEEITEGSLEQLDQSGLDTEDLFKVFDDWQSKKTLTSKRIFVSTSSLVAAASWIGIDYTKLTLFGLEVADGAPARFLIFIVTAIVVSGIFYEISRRIDLSVRRARIAHVDRDLKELNESFKALQGVMERNNVDSIVDLYFDFRSSLIENSKHNAIDVFRAIEFYDSHLTRAGYGLRIVTIGEQAVIYLIALYAIIALIQSL